MSLRIHNPTNVISPRGGTPQPGSPAPPSAGDDWLSRLVKLIPGEAMVAYTAGKPYKEWLTLVMILSLAILILVRWKTTQANGNGAQWAAIGISVGAFLVWIISLGDSLFGYDFKVIPEAIRYLIVTAYVIAAGIIYKGD